MEENTEGNESGFSGNEIAPCNNERATFLTFCVSVHSIAHIVLAPGGNLTSEKAEMKWVWVEILHSFTGLRESSRTFLRGNFQWDHSSLPESRRWGCV